MDKRKGREGVKLKSMITMYMNEVYESIIQYCSVVGCGHLLLLLVLCGIMWCCSGVVYRLSRFRMINNEIKEEIKLEKTSCIIFQQSTVSLNTKCLVLATTFNTDR